MLGIRSRPVLAAAAWLAACGPSLTDEPREYQGDGDFAIAALCSAETVEAGEKAWAKFAIRHVPAVQPDWDGETLEVRGGLLTRRAAGRPTPQDDGTIRRIETFWVTAPASAKAGEVLQVGPLELRYAGKGRASRRGSHPGCTFRVE